MGTFDRSVSLVSSLGCGNAKTLNLMQKKIKVRPNFRLEVRAVRGGDVRASCGIRATEVAVIAFTFYNAASPSRAASSRGIFPA
jgi:hypothetical protein